VLILVSDGELPLASKPSFVARETSPIGEVVEYSVFCRFGVENGEVEVCVEVGMCAERSGPSSFSSSRAADQDKALAALLRWDCLINKWLKGCLCNGVLISHVMEYPMPDSSPRLRGAGGA